MSLEGRVIMITGAAQGVGRGVAKKAGALGATLALVDLNDEGAQETAAAGFFPRRRGQAVRRRDPRGKGYQRCGSCRPVIPKYMY